jgi:hypothetical protein
MIPSVFRSLPSTHIWPRILALKHNAIGGLFFVASCHSDVCCHFGLCSCVIEQKWLLYFYPAAPHYSTHYHVRGECLTQVYPCICWVTINKFYSQGNETDDRLCSFFSFYLISDMFTIFLWKFNVAGSYFISKRKWTLFVPVSLVASVCKQRFFCGGVQNLGNCEWSLKWNFLLQFYECYTSGTNYSIKQEQHQA